MKKLKIVFVVLAAVTALWGCSGNNNTRSETQNTEVTFSGDDIALFYALDTGELKPAVNLFMKEENIPYDNEAAADLLNGCDIGFEEYDGVNYVNYIYLRGTVLPVYTAKDIKTIGLDYYNEEAKDKCSDEEDIITAYGLNPDEEEIYYKSSQSSESVCLAVFYNIENDGSAERIKYPKGTDISGFEGLDANACTIFEVRDGKVIGITMKSKILMRKS